MIKFFLHISQKEQRKRFDKMLHSKETAWKVSKEDEKRNKEYHRYKEICEEMLERTESEYAPWILIEAEDRRFATAKIFSQVIQQLKERVCQEREKVAQKSEMHRNIQMETDQKNLMESSVLSKVDLTLAYTEEEYKRKLKTLQERLGLLHSELYRKRIPMVLGFEGWDAGEKEELLNGLQMLWIQEGIW